MITQNNIIDEPLPLTQNFRSLKDMALGFIQSHVGAEWTNLNTSDPGITILDQLCYALTELGYCNDFPVKDILTGADGKLKIKNQFYLPQDILTTSPVTAKDYIKYLIDGVTGVNNAVITQAIQGNTPIPQTYQIYLMLDKSVKNQTEVCWAAFVYLNKSRNLDEVFLMPMPLEPILTYLQGSITIKNKWELDTTLVQINTVISNYIFPKVTLSGYGKLVADGVIINEIFNGPLLETGWIPEDSLIKKKESLNILEIISLIESVSGVKSVSELKFYTENSINSGKSILDSTEAQIFEIDVMESFKKGYFNITCNNETIAYEADGFVDLSIISPVEYEKNIVFGASLDIQTNLPIGSYRDINSYFSIQNTFPGIFAIGENSTVANATDYQIAQSRQLQGYLTLFDQILANQFSQLANIDKLFSFENTMTGNPSDRDNFYAHKDKYQKEHPGYPAPYIRFTPTYFYQSLYNIPYIKPLLKDNEVFSFSMGLEPEKIQEQKSWEKYMLDPYNAYMVGLTEIMEDENTNLTRRNDILNHLLARHGESPLMMDTYINGSFYTKKALMDKIIFKSLYLQNFGLLSYYRYKAYNFQAADLLNPIHSEVKTKNTANIDDFEMEVTDNEYIDFIFNSRGVEWKEKLVERDFINYSAVELKLSLLFGLRILYRNFLENMQTSQIAIGEEKKQALWFINKRRGFMLIEMELLLQHFNFEFLLIDSKIKQAWQVTDVLNYGNILDISMVLANMQENDIDILTTNGSLITPANTYQFKKIGSNGEIINNNYNNIGGTEYYFLVKIINPNSANSGVELPNFNTKLEIFFPKFIYPFATAEFQIRLNTFLQNELPVNLSYMVHLLKTELITPLANAFVNWHNSMVYHGNANDISNDITGYAWELLTEIVKSYNPTLK